MGDVSYLEVYGRWMLTYLPIFTRHLDKSKLRIYKHLLKNILIDTLS